MYDKMIEKIENLLKNKENVIIAIDGRCASGKTTISEKLKEKFDCNVIHMDDFFLQPWQRTEKRLSIPGENIDHERFLEEVLIPLFEKKNFLYRPFDCRTQDFSKSVKVDVNKITVIEGSYSCHEKLRGYYDICVFTDVEEEEQLRRIEKRNGKEALEIFKNKWIPLEEKYFKTFDIKGKSEIVIK